MIIDNLSCFTRGIEENGKRDWDPIGDWLGDLRAIGAAVIIIHHANKDGGQRGTSAREDALDFSIKLNHPAGYRQEDGADFIVSFTKNRSLFGDDVKPFRIKLENVENRICWKSIDDKKTTEEEIIALFKEGNTAKYISKQLGISDVRISQAKADAIESGELKNEDVKTEKPGRKPKKLPVVLVKKPLDEPPIEKVVEEPIDVPPIERVVEEPIDKPPTTPEEEVEQQEQEFVEVFSRSELENV